MPVTTAAEISRYRETKIESFGRKIDIPRASIHRFTNIFIEESRPFIPQESLPIYHGVPLWFTIPVLALSFGGAASLVGAIVCLIADAPMIIIYFQNEWVNRTSLPIIKRQPVKDDLQTLNALYEVTVSELEMIALSSYDKGIGFIRTSYGKVKFQVFHPAALELMDKAKSTSRILLGLFLFVAVYNIFFIVLYSLINKE